MKLTNVLVATDFGDAADTALAYARELAKAFGATLHVVHVLENLVAGPATEAGPPVEVSPPLQKLEQAARTALDSSVTDDDRRQLRATTTLLTGSSAALAILTHARDIAADLIVIGTHGRGAMAKLLMGSVAEKIVRAAGCPVLTVRRPGHEFALHGAVQTTTAQDRA